MSDQEILIAYRFARAYEALDEAKLLSDTGLEYSG